MEIIDHKFLTLFFPDVGMTEMSLKKFTVRSPRLLNSVDKIIINEMQQEDFVSTKLLKNAIFRKVKNFDGELINCLKTY